MAGRPWRGVGLLALLAWLSLGCGGSASGPADTSSDSAASPESSDTSPDLGTIDDDPGLSDVGEDASPPMDTTVDAAEETDVELTDVEVVDVEVVEVEVGTSEVDVIDVDVADTLDANFTDAVVEDTQSSDCEYTCDIDCQCKTDPLGCDLDACESDECLQLMGTIDALLPALQTCQSEGDCVLFEFPICGTMGCFQRGVHQDADLTELSTLAQEGVAAQCSGFHCGCWILGQPECIAGECVLTPVQQ